MVRSVEKTYLRTNQVTDSLLARTDGLVPCSLLSVWVILGDGT